MHMYTHTTDTLTYTSQVHVQMHALKHNIQNGLTPMLSLSDFGENIKIKPAWEDFKLDTMPP